MGYGINHEFDVTRMDPVEYATVRLGFNGRTREESIYNWQAGVMWDVEAQITQDVPPVACVTPNESGKTSILIATLALWCAEKFPGSTVVITSATTPQLKDQVMPALHEHQSRYPGWVFNDKDIRSPEGSTIIGRATDQGGRFEGYHAYPGKPLLIIVDEAKSIRDDIFEAIDRCNPTMLLLVSSPGGRIGQFAEAIRSKDGSYKVYEVTLEDCPHITPERVEKMRRKYGEDSDIFRSMILGKFGLDIDDGTVIPYGLIENCYRMAPTWQPGEVVAFCDFAESSDENVLAIREGNRVKIPDAWRQLDGNKDAVTARFVRLYKANGLAREGMIYGDASGMGYGYIYALRQLGWNIIPVENNDKPDDPHYFNRGAEMWWKARRRIEECTIILPEDSLLKKQLCERRKKEREDGRLQLEPKKEMKGKSPDRGDAVVGAIACKRQLVVGHAGVKSSVVTDLREAMEVAQSQEALPGCFTG